MSSWAPKRFWTEVAIVPEGEGFAVTLDGRPVRTPLKARLAVPTRVFAEEVARRVPDGRVPAFGDLVRPEVLATLPEPVRDGVAEAFAAAFSDLFLTALPVLAVGLAAALLLPDVPLKPRGPQAPPREAED